MGPSRAPDPAGGGSVGIALASRGSGIGYGVAAVWLLTIPLGLLLAVAIPVLLFLDARELGEHNLDWTPNPGLYAVLGLLFSGLTMLHYLYRRQESVRNDVAGEKWWLLAVGAVIVPLLISAFVFLTNAFPPIMLSMALKLLLPVAVYRDAAYVRTAGGGWSPSPTMQFTVALFAIVLPFTGGLYLACYLYKRYTSVGLP